METAHFFDREIESTISEIQKLDPELLKSPETKKLIELGAIFGKEITDDFGTPIKPKWASGTFEQNVLMAYHNGGQDGHTSVGPNSIGVPRSALIIAQTINQAAGSEVFNPLDRATAFYSAMAHDSKQLCGRTLMPEGQQEGFGDERLSAQYAYERYMGAGGEPQIAQQIYKNIMATAFNPELRAQNIDYTNTQGILGQELLAAADLFGLTNARGPLCSLEYTLEGLGFHQNGRLLQKNLNELPPVGHVDEFIKIVGQNKALVSAFAEILSGHAKFFTAHSYSDRAIKHACGQGIDSLFPGRQQNATTLAQFAEQLEQGVGLDIVWDQARALLDAGRSPNAVTH